MHLSYICNLINSRYLAPEYINGGKITQKVDVYAFGVVLLELMTGQRMSEIHLYEGQHFLSDLHTLAALEPSHVLQSIYRLLDPYLATEKGHEFSHQLKAMGQAAFLCLHPDPESRPAMSKVCLLIPLFLFYFPTHGSLYKNVYFLYLLLRAIL